MSDKMTFDELVKEIGTGAAIEVLFVKHGKLYIENLIGIEYDEWSKVFDICINKELKILALQNMANKSNTSKEYVKVLKEAERIFNSHTYEVIREKLKKMNFSFDSWAEIFFNSKHDDVIRSIVKEKMKKSPKSCYLEWKDVLVRYYSDEKLRAIAMSELEKAEIGLTSAVDQYGLNQVVKSHKNAKEINDFLDKLLIKKIKKMKNTFFDWYNLYNGFISREPLHKIAIEKMSQTAKTKEHWVTVIKIASHFPAIKSRAIKKMADYAI